jgi:hypothetical protein
LILGPIPFSTPLVPPSSLSTKIRLLGRYAEFLLAVNLTFYVGVEVSEPAWSPESFVNRVSHRFPLELEAGDRLPVEQP